MSAEDAIIGSIITAVIAFPLGIYTQRWNIKRSTIESTKERVYSPLFDEIDEVLSKLKQSEPPFTGLTGWSKVTKELHLGYLIQPPDLYEKLEKFYDTTMNGVTSGILAIRGVFNDRIKRDLDIRVPGAPITGYNPESNIQQVALGISSYLLKGEIPFWQFPSYEGFYDNLLSNSFSNLPKSFQEYFDFWKEKWKQDDVVAKYDALLKRAISEAETLRKLLGLKIGRVRRKLVVVPARQASKN